MLRKAAGWQRGYRGSLDSRLRLLDILTDEVITAEEDEQLLKTAAIHANLVLDSMDLKRTTRMYLRIDQPFSKQSYLKELYKLDFETLIEMMNCKVEYQNEKDLK
jgi:hypothetical protein